MLFRSIGTGCSWRRARGSIRCFCGTRERRGDKEQRSIRLPSVLQKLLRTQDDLAIGLADDALVLALVVDRREHAADGLEPRATLVVGADDGPGRVLAVGLAQHALEGLRVVVPFLDRLGVDVGNLPAIELVVPGSTDPNPAAMQAVVKYCQSKGVLLLTAGTYSNVIRLLPPLVMPEHLLREALAILDEALATL